MLSVLCLPVRNPLPHPQNMGSAAFSTVRPELSKLNIFVNGAGVSTPASDASCANMLRQLTPSTVYRIYNMPSTRPAGHARSSVFTAA